MPLYLSQQTLKEAISRLGTSSAQSSYGDYLVFKRALKLTHTTASGNGETMPNMVVTGTASEPFLQAHIDVGLRVPEEHILRSVGENTLIACMQALIGKRREQSLAHDPSLAQPYFVPFGAQRDSNRGYRKAKWPSNGPSDTVSRWQSRGVSPFVLVRGTSPKAYRYDQRTEKELEDFFLTKNTSDSFSSRKPHLLDAAIWWFRFIDLETRFRNEPAPEQLIRAYIEEIGLTDTEISALFTQEASNNFSSESRSEDDTAQGGVQ
jgi:hypothetical protein